MAMVMVLRKRMRALGNYEVTSLRLRAYQYDTALL
jgi:hypothetical protein